MEDGDDAAGALADALPSRPRKAKEEEEDKDKNKNKDKEGQNNDEKEKGEKPNVKSHRSD